MAGQYVRNSSVHTTFTRGIVVHGSQNALIENNVGYESFSHMYIFAEDGSEYNNTFRNNLGVLVRFLPAERRIFKNDASNPNDRTVRSQDEHRPSVFWGLNMDNTLVGNVAAGTQSGNGYHFAGAGRNGSQGTFVFADNTAYSNASNTGGNDRYPPLTRGYGIFVKSVHPRDAGEYTFSNFTAFKNSIAGIWVEHEQHRFAGGIVADNSTGIILERSTIEDLVIVGQSANTNGELKRLGDGFRGTGVSTVTNQGGPKRFTLRKISFVNVPDAAVGMRNTSLEPQTSAQAITLIDTPRAVAFSMPEMAGGMLDADGSLTGTGVPTMVLGNRALQTSAACAFREPWNVYLCPGDHTLASFFVTRVGASRNDGLPIQLTRDDGLIGGMSRENNDTGTSVMAGRIYQLDFTEGRTFAQLIISAGTSRFTRPDTTPANWLIVGVKFNEAQPFLYFEDPVRRGDQADPANAVPAVGSLAELQANPMPAYFFDHAQGRVFVRIIGGPDHLPIYVCTTAACDTE